MSRKYLANKQETDPPSLYEYMLQKTPSQFVNAHKALLPDLIDDKVLGQIIINMSWAVRNMSPAAHTLLTADRPFVTTHGLGDPQCLLSIPISPTHLFVAANSRHRLEMIASEPLDNMVRYSNDAVVRLAVENVYGCTTEHLRFVENRLRRISDPPTPGPIARE